MTDFLTKFLFVAAMALTASGTSANSYFHPKWSPDGQKIAFYGYINKQPDIFVTDVASGESIRVTDTPDNWEIEPAWLDNHNLAINSGANMKKIRLKALNIGTQEQNKMTQHTEMLMFVDHLRGSEQMLVNWQEREDWGFYKMNLNGSKPKRLSTLEGLFVYKIFWHTNTALATYQDDIVLINLDGEIEKYLVKTTDKESYPDLSSDQTKLIYVSDKSGHPDVYLTDLSNGQVAQLTNDELPEYALQFSPDNRYFIFAGVETKYMDILAMDLKGNLLRNFTKAMH